MAPFNPQIPDKNDPSYLGYSKPIDQPESDKSAGLMLKGFGEMITGVAKAGDAVTKSVIDDQIYKSVDTERNAFGEALETMLPGGALDITKTAQNKFGEDVPPGLEGVEGQFEGLQSAFGQGKISRTDYIGKLRATAKQLRAQFPGYREYIDDRISKTVGFDPANKYLESLITDLNRSATAGSAEFKKKLAYAKEGEVFPNGDVLMKRMFSDNPPSWQELIDHQSKYKQNKVYMDRLEQELRLKDNLSTSNQKTAQAAAGQEANGLMISLFERLRLEAKPGEAIPNTAQDLAKYLQGVQAGTVPKPTAQQAVRLGMFLQAMETEAKSQLERFFTTALSEDKTDTWIKRMGPEGLKHKDEIISRTVQQFAQLRQGFLKGDMDLVAAQQKITEAVYSDVENQWLQDGDVAKILGQFDLFKRRTPEAAWPFVQQQFSLGLGDKLKTWATKMKVDAINPHPSGNPAHTSLKEIHSSMESVPNNKFGPEDYKDVKDLTNLIANPKADVITKREVAYKAFGPRNNGYLDKFIVDGYDSKGVWREGKFKVFNDMTTPEMSKSVKALERFDSNIPKIYVNWARENFRLDLFATELQDLNVIQADPRVKLHFDTDNSQWVIRTNPQTFRDSSGGIRQGSGPMEQRRLEQYETSIRNLNSGIANMKVINQTFGLGDTNAWLIREMTAGGFRPSPGSQADQMLKSLQTATTPPPKEGSGNASQSQNKGRGRVLESAPLPTPRSNYSPEKKQRTLGEFLANPVPDAPPPQQTPGPPLPTGRVMPPGQNMIDQGDITGIQVIPNPQGLSPSKLLGK